jgi:hypothetical protein
MRYYAREGDERIMHFGVKVRWKEISGKKERNEDNIKMDLRETRWGGRDWINLADDWDLLIALGITVMNLRVP